MQEVTLKEIQKIVDQWIKKVGVRYFSELTNLGQLMEEVGEVAHIITRKYGEQNFKNSEQNLNLDEELADVLFVIICLANQTKTDLTQAFLQTIEKKTKRDSLRHKSNPKLKRDL